jgi:phosphatidylserine/phosphatidylglycerophosphate/cardiolipin synthase-like enzyme
MRNIFKRSHQDLLSSSLHTEVTFYDQLKRDLRHCKNEVIIESPFLTYRRAEELSTIFAKLVKRKVKIIIRTRYPEEHSGNLRIQAELTIPYLAKLGVEVRLIPNRLHRKLAIIDRRVLWEGSLNILSQNNSSEIMRRVDSRKLSLEMLRFIKHNAII